MNKVYELVVYVLLRAAPDQPLLDLVRGAGRFDRVDLSGRFRCWVGFSGEKPVFHTEDPERLVERLRAGLPHDVPVEAFAEADPEALRRLDGQQFHFDNHVFEVRVAGDPARHVGFFNRAVTLTYRGQYAPTSLEELPGVEEKHESELPALYLDPVPLEFTPVQAAAFFKRPEVAATGALVCPPVRVTGHAGYHAEEYRTVRAQIRLHYGLDSSGSEVPTALRQWIALDAVELRDLLASGAFLTANAGTRGRTDAALNVPHPTDAPGAYRARFYFGEASEHTRAFARALRADVRELVSGGLELVASKTSADWSIPVAGNSDPGDAPAEGTWQRGFQLAEGLENCEARIALDKDLTKTRGRTGQSANHALFERLLTGKYLRGDGPTIDTGWVQTVTTVALPYLLAPEKPTPAGLLAGVMLAAQGRLERTAGDLVLKFTGDVAVEGLRRWRLLLPPGARVVPDNTMVLGTPSADLRNQPMLDFDAEPESMLRDWHERRPVTPSDMANLEDHIRWLVGSRPEGLIRYVGGASLVLVGTLDGALMLVARDLSGTTAAGLAVRLKAGDRVACPLPEERPEAGFDVWVETTDGTAPFAERDPDERVYRNRLVAAAAQPGSPRPVSKPNQLDLGRFARTEGGALVRLNFPKVQSFDAMLPSDEEWMRFAGAVREAVVRLQRRLDDFAPKNWAHRACESLAATTVLNWSEMRFDKLAKRLRAMCRLRRYARGEDLSEPVAPPNFADVPGDKIPDFFADLFDEVDDGDDTGPERPLVEGRDIKTRPGPDGTSVTFLLARPYGCLRARFVSPEVPEGTVMLYGPNTAHRMTPPVAPAYALGSAPFEPIVGETYRIEPAIPACALSWIANRPQPVVKGTVS